MMSVMEPMASQRRPGEMRPVWCSALLAATLVLVGCSAHNTQASGSSSPEHPPSVVGLHAVSAFHRLNAAHYGVTRVQGVWSHKARGVILAQNSDTTAGADAIRLTASMGSRDTAGDVITLPGISMCDLGVHPAVLSCRGGPVTLWTRNRH